MSKSSFIEHLHADYTNHFAQFPSKQLAESFIHSLFHYLFPHRDEARTSIECLKDNQRRLKNELEELLLQLGIKETKANTISQEFFDTDLPVIYALLKKDANAILQFDPAANSIEEVIIAYPGFYAISIYRFAHEILKKGIDTLPRIFTEWAHSRTGIDIHPGAEIGESFFIDHGTGVVIGETTVIGKNVKIYQGVTLGALIVNKEQSAKKRHPSIEDDVIIYSGTTILGGNTIIGSNSIIGGNVWLTESIPAHSYVYNTHEVKKRVKVR